VASYPACGSPPARAPGFTKIEDCLAVILTAVNVTAACIACTWLPGHISQQPAHQTLTLLGKALGSDLAWQAPHGTDST
jgi:arginase